MSGSTGRPRPNQGRPKQRHRQAPPAQRYWFALLTCGVLLALALPLYRTTGRSCSPPVTSIDGMSSCSVEIGSPQGVLGAYDLAHPAWLRLYWLLALAVGTGALLWWYRRAAATVRILAPLAVALGLAAITVLLTRSHWSGFHSPTAWAESAYLLVFNGATPLIVIAATLLALAVAERSLPLGVFALANAALGYLFATYDSLHLLHQLGLPISEINDPAGIRQLLNLAIPAVFLLLAARLAHLAGRRAPRS
ncbi:hypothetical protein [Kitasatospora azatica]|uniref:hypothetical protein n=1 Tax=Kitasatospora azatica TaxID=58347 RepID=UPI000568F36A|nr:hypothetical protein [Kitasatospora azatica]